MSGVGRKSQVTYGTRGLDDERRQVTFSSHQLSSVERLRCLH